MKIRVKICVISVLFKLNDYKIKIIKNAINKRKTEFPEKYFKFIKVKQKYQSS
jgi:hypothetical protein